MSTHVPPDLDGTVCGTAKAIWLLLGRSPPLDASAIETELNDTEHRVTYGIHQLRQRDLIEYDRTHGGYKRAYGGDSE